MRDTWRPKDPIVRLQKYLQRRGVWTEQIGEAMDREVSAELDAAWAEAQATPLSTVAESLSHVFAEMPPRLAAQRAAIEEGR